MFLGDILAANTAPATQIDSAGTVTVGTIPVPQTRRMTGEVKIEELARHSFARKIAELEAVG
jgi:hypothetical protein